MAFDSETIKGLTMLPVHIHLVRHARVDSHRGDVPITADAVNEIDAAARCLAEAIEPGEVVHFLTTGTERSRQTATRLVQQIEQNVGRFAQVVPPRDEWGIRNPDLFLAGRRVELVSTAEAMADQLVDGRVSAEDVDRVQFYNTFFRSVDRIGYWLHHQNPPGEDMAAVARRVIGFCESLADVEGESRRRYVCVTHSPIMRAVLLQHLLREDPGEPDWVESIDIELVDSVRRMRFRGAEREIRYR